MTFSTSRFRNACSNRLHHMVIDYCFKDVTPCTITACTNRLQHTVIDYWTKNVHPPHDFALWPAWPWKRLGATRFLHTKTCTPRTFCPFP